MTGLRRLFAHRRRLVAWLIAATLAVRVLVPGGYMPAVPGSLTLMICSGHMGPETMRMAMPGGARHDAGGPAGEHERGDQACPFAGLAMPSLAAADAPAAGLPMLLPPVVLRAALADARAPPRRVHHRPPPTGPPSLA